MSVGCISFDSYIKPQREHQQCCFLVVVYLLIPTSNHNHGAVCMERPQLYIFWFLHQTTTGDAVEDFLLGLYIFWFLHQTTTRRCCINISLMLYIFWFLHQTTTPILGRCRHLGLYIFWFLHQTTTDSRWNNIFNSCISFDSYIKPQLSDEQTAINISCISFDSYIKPQLNQKIMLICNSCISFDSYIKPQPITNANANASVVYLLIPTSNHNFIGMLLLLQRLYIFWFLHQTTTNF